MNIINIILLAILLISFISGMQKGFLASLLATLGFAAWLIAWSLCGTLANHFMNSSFKEALSGLDPFRELVAKLGENGSVLCNGAASTLNGICETLTDASVPKAVIDAFRRKVVGWSMSERITEKVAIDAMEQAVAANKAGRPFLVEAPMENIVVPTPGCWNINDIYSPNDLVRDGKLVQKENGVYITPNHAKSHKAK